MDGQSKKKYKVLLFPFRTSESLPKTSWNADHTKLTVDKGNGDIDILTFSTDPTSHRTKIELRNEQKHDSVLPFPK